MKQKTKNILLVIGFVFALIICYQVSISKTFALKKQLNTLKAETTHFENIATLSANLKKREFYADSILEKNNLKNISVQNNLLEIINTASEVNKFDIEAFNRPHKVLESNVTQMSYSFRLKGNFNDLLDVIYHLEQKTNLGRITHFNFEKKRNYRRNSNYLECFVILESLVSE